MRFFIPTVIVLLLTLTVGTENIDGSRNAQVSAQQKRVHWENHPEYSRIAYKKKVGDCPCPEDKDARGRRCGNESAYCIDFGWNPEYCREECDR